MSQVRKHSFISAFAVFGSRLMGLVREMVLAFFFGAGPVLDAFVAAFRIPNLLRDLFAEGALSNAFVTVFSKRATTDLDGAWDLTNRVLTFVFVVVGTLTLAGILFSPWIVSLVASGFEGEKFAFAVTLNRLLFPFILFVSLAAVMMGMLNARGKFGLPQSASTFFNLTSILVGLGIAYFFTPDFIGGTIKYLLGQGARPVPTWPVISEAMIGMAIGTLAGGLVQWLVQMPAALKAGLKPCLNFGWNNHDFIQVLKLTGPAIIGGAAVQVNVLVNTNFASYLVDGSMAWLNFAFRLMQFPIGVFGVAVALATTPAMARLIAQKREAEYVKTFRESTQLTLFLCIPSALGLMVFAEPILALIYQYGQFGAADTRQAAHALMAYASGLCFYALIKIYQPAFVAFNDARTPMILSLVSIALNFGINWYLVFELHFAHWGLALGTSLVALSNSLMLGLLLRKHVRQVWSASLFLELLKIILAALLAVGSGWFVHQKFLHWFGMEGLGMRLLTCLVPILLTAVFYYVFSRILKIQETQFVRGWITKKTSF